MLSLLPCSTIAFAPLPAVRSSNVHMTISVTPGGEDFAKTQMVGVTAPFGFFDPLGLTADKSVEEVQLFREAELTHGRVAMMGAVGFLVQEAFHPIFADLLLGEPVPAARQLDLVLSTSNGQLAGSVLLMAIFFSEFHRARTGWVEPDVAPRTLREGYLPGDLGFDPMGLKPKDAGLLSMQNKELNNGRLAMIAVAGMCVQEIVTGVPILGADVVYN